MALIGPTVVDLMQLRHGAGQPAEAVETMQLHETDGVTTLTTRLAFRDKAGRDHMTRFDGQQDSFGAMEDILGSVLGPTGTSPS
jgi:hypothetical protein